MNLYKQTKNPQQPTFHSTRFQQATRKMSTPILTLFLMLFGLFSAGELMAYELTIVIDNNLKKESGTLYLSLFDSAEDFDADRTDATKAVFSFFKQDFKPGESIKVKVSDIPVGEYAYRFFLDENNNTELDVTALKRPREPYGFSKENPRLGAPSFDDVKFRFGHNKTIASELK